MSQYLTFELQGRDYGVRVDLVNSVLDPQAITPLPASSTIVTGLTNVRGDVVPVFDPGRILLSTKVDETPDAEAGDGGQGGPGDGAKDEGGILIFDVENGTLLPYIGMKADRIGKVVTVEGDELSPVPSLLPRDASRFFEGFCFIGGVRHSIINLGELASRETLFGSEEGARRE